MYEVIHLETARRRALKVMHPQFLQSQEMRDRFRQEARVAAQIESEFIVDVFDAGIDDITEMPFLVMELLKGEELGKLLKQRGRLTAPEVVTYLHQAALALDKTHRAQIVHRDLKPENLFLTEREDGLPRVKILDFGIAKVVADSGTHMNATRSLGTPLYMAPEQFKPGYRVSPSADLYALSMMAYTLLVGRSYWAEEATGGNVFAFAAVAVSGPPEPATVRAQRVGVALPGAFDAWFARATSPQPEHRFPTASATVAGLAESLGLPVPGISASGGLGASAARTQALAPDSPSALSSSARSGAAASQSGPVSGLHGSWPVPGAQGTGSISGAHGTGPISSPQGSGPVTGVHGSGPVAGMAVSGPAIGAVGTPAAPGRMRGVVGLVVGGAFLLGVAAVAAYVLWLGAPPSGQASSASAVPTAEATTPAASATAATEPAPSAVATTDAAPSTTATARPAATAAGTPKPVAKPTAAPIKKPVHARD